MKGAQPAAVKELGRLDDRFSFLYVEHARVDRELNSITIMRADGMVRVPAAMLASLLLGPGTRVTHAAVQLLAGSGASVAWAGEDGVRLYAGAVATATSSRLLLRQAALATRPPQRVAVARRMYEMRFPGENVSGLTMQKLRGREGARVRACYRAHADRTGVPWTARHYDRGHWSAADPVNRALSSANAALYGVVHAAIHFLGCSPALGFVHTGRQLSFVYDMADLYKAETTIPAAFDVVAEGVQDVGGRARRAVRDQVTALKLLPRIVTDIRALLLAGEDDGSKSAQVVGLWDGDAVVTGGVNYEDGAP